MQMRVNNPERQLGARVREDMVCFINQRLSISCITLEESKYSDGQQNQKSDCEDR